MKVEVYRCLPKSGGCNGQNVYSIRALEEPVKGFIIAHATHVVIVDPKFVVQPAGNAKVRATGAKMVHAFVRG